MQERFWSLLLVILGLWAGLSWASAEDKAPKARAADKAAKPKKRATKAPARRAAVRNTPARKAPARRAPARRAPVPRAPVPRAPVRRAPAKKVPARRAPAKAKKAASKPSKKPPFVRIGVPLDWGKGEIKLKKPKARTTPKRRRRRRRRRRRPPKLKMPKITAKDAGNLARLKLLATAWKGRHWRFQRVLAEQFAKRKGKTQQALHWALQHPHPRIRLLAAQTLAMRKDPKAIPMLLQLAERLYDQPVPLLMGALMAYGKSAVGPVVKALPKARFPHHLLRALGFLQSHAALLAPYLSHKDRRLRSIVRETLQRFPKKQMVQVLEKVFGPKIPADVRSDIIRMLSYRPTTKGVALLVKALTDGNSSVRFLARISLEDQAASAHRALPKKIGKPPTSKKPVDWQRWWKKHQAAVDTWFQRQDALVLKALPKKDRKRVLLIYRTIHPVFGYGRMPLMIHDASWNKPPSPIRGKIWRLGLPTKAFEALLQKVEKSGYFGWNPNMGKVRDLSVYAGKRWRRVSIGAVRHLPFEALEAAFLKLTRKAKLGLKFNDFYFRRDEGDVIREGRIGLWAYRKADVLPLRTWSPDKGWTPRADIEGAWGALRDSIRFMPSRSRLVSVDLDKLRIRYSVLLYGSRSQSRLTRDGLLKSRRLHSFKLAGLGIIYLSSDKIEQMIFDLKRRALPFNSRSSDAKTQKSQPVLSMIQQVWKPATSKMLQFSWKSGKIERFYVRFKTLGTHSMLNTLARLAVRSRGDRLLGLRINPSGEADRHRFKLIVQMQWEMKQPLPAPAKMPYALRPETLVRHEPFAPVYR